MARKCHWSSSIFFSISTKARFLVGIQDLILIADNNGFARRNENGYRPQQELAEESVPLQDKKIAGSIFITITLVEVILVYDCFNKNCRTKHCVMYLAADEKIIILKFINADIKSAMDNEK